MSEINSVIQSRKIISELIIDILSGKINIQDAIKKFPQNINDESAQCAFHAILHYEADEDYRQHDLLYSEEQKDYLEYIANLFENGEDIPANIIEEYKKYYESAPLLSKKGIIYALKNLFRLTT